MRSALFAPLLALSCLAPTAQLAQAQGSPRPVFELWDAPVSSGANICTATSFGLKPSVDATTSIAYRVTFGIMEGETDARLILRVTNTAKNVSLNFNLGSADCTAGNAYNFAWTAKAGFTYNLRVSASTRIGYLLVEEISGNVPIGSAQGSSGGGASGGVSNPLTANLDLGGYGVVGAGGSLYLDPDQVYLANANDTAYVYCPAGTDALELHGAPVNMNGTDRLAFGGTDSGKPAMRYSGASNTIELLGGDGSSQPVAFKATSSGSGIQFYSDSGSKSLIIDDTGVSVNGSLLANSTATVQFGGTTSTYPAMRYGSGTGVIEFVRADGSDGVTYLQGPAGQSIALALEGGANVACDSTGVTLQNPAQDAVAIVGSRGLSVGIDSGYSLALKDQTSAPSVTAGYQGVYSLNTSGLQQLVVKGGSGAVTLATQGYYAAGAHVSLKRTTDQTFTNAGEAISWSSATVNQGSLHDNSGAPTKVITAPAAGVFRFWVQARWQTNNTDVMRGVIIRRYNSSGTEQQAVVKLEYWANINAAHHQLANFELHFSAGDYLIVFGYVPDADGSPSLDMDDAGAGATACTLEGFFVPD